jgi:thiamine biosynthesis protein ThiS
LDIVVNGESRDVPEAATVTVLLEVLNVMSRGVAVEVNRQLVARAQHANHKLSPGDHVEIVTLVGGG